MKSLAYALFAACAFATVLAFGVMEETVAPGFGTYFGAFVIPFLLGWWGKIALDKSRGPKGPNGETPLTHVRCPDCKELVLKQASVCKHCKATLVPSDA